MLEVRILLQLEGRSNHAASPSRSLEERSTLGLLALRDKQKLNLKRMFAWK
jgi:hypothetical protein